jgi:hypothetical protein
VTADIEAVLIVGDGHRRHHRRGRLHDGRRWRKVGRGRHAGGKCQDGRSDGKTQHLNGLMNRKLSRSYNVNASPRLSPNGNAREGFGTHNSLPKNDICGHICDPSMASLWHFQGDPQSRRSTSAGVFSLCERRKIGAHFPCAILRIEGACCHPGLPLQRTTTHDVPSTKNPAMP